MFSLRLFGGASIEGPDGPLAGRAAQRHRLALLALLAATPRGGLTRDKLIAHLWPERDAERARHSLSDSVYRINKAIGDEAIVAVADELRLDPERLGSDLHAFWEAVEAQDWEGAVASYAGPFLDGFHLPAAGEFEHWLDVERSRLARQFAAALEAVADRRAEGGDLTGAAAAWRRRAAHDPYDSRVAVRLMEALEAAGNRAGALQHARIHVQLLEEEFGTGPDPDVLALAERLRTAPTPEADPAETRREGRERERSEPPREPSAGRPTTPSGTASRATRDGSSRPKHSVAVLPFVNLSPDPNNEYFADGMAEELIDVLARIPELQVPARSSSFAFKEKALQVREMAERLGVAYVLEGGVRKAGKRLRITARLVEAAGGYHVWTETYDRRLEDVFAVQEEIARAIASALRVRLGVGVTELARRGTRNVDAYVLYLKGRFHLNKRKRSAYKKAIECFQRAIEVDREYALAYAGLADLYLLSERYTVLDPEKAIPLARAAAEHAVELAPERAETRTSLAYARMLGDWDPGAADREFRRAIRNDPGYAPAHHWYGWNLLQRGLLDRGLAELRRALELEPLSLIVQTNVGTALYMMRRFDEAIDACRRALQLDSRFVVAHQWLGRARELAGRPHEGAAAHRRALEILGGEDPESIGSLGHARALAGDRKGAMRALSRLEELSRRRYVSRYWPALVHIGMRALERGLNELERAFEERFDWCLFVGVDPMFDPLRGDPRFEALLRLVSGTPGDRPVASIRTD